MFDYDYELVLGTLAEIRAHALHHAKTDVLPRWEFTTARQGWHYRGAGDTGWPIRGELQISPRADVPPGGNALAPGQWQILSPEFLLRGDPAAKLVIDAAFAGTGKTISILWRGPGDGKANWQPAEKIQVVPDGRMRRYEIPLKKMFAQATALTQLRFDLQSAGTNAAAHLRSVAFE